MIRTIDERSAPRFIGVLRLDKESGIPDYKEIDDEEYIRYEVSVFNAYKVAYEHNVKNREQIRRMLEEEVLNVPQSRTTRLPRVE